MYILILNRIYYNIILKGEITMTNFDLYLEEQLKDTEFLKEYKALEPEYEIIKQIIKSRTEQNMTQKQLAEKI